MTTELRGQPAAPGVATGAPWVLGASVTEGTAAILGLDEASAAARADLERLGRLLRAEGRLEEAAILEAQAMMAADPELIDAAREGVAAGADPVAAVTAAGGAVATAFEAMDDAVLAARAADVRDVTARIVRHLVGASAPKLERRSIVVSFDLPPSVTVELDRSLLAGIALEGGSRTSHAAILARSLGIPAVVAVAGLLAAVDGARELALDGAAGTVAVDPDEAVGRRLAAAAVRDASGRSADDAYRSRPLVTADGQRVTCAANIGDPTEAVHAMAAGAEGIGLFRTEFAFAARSSAPSEEQQAGWYASVLRAAGNATVVFRLADIGGDKPLPYLALQSEPHPFLGVRAIRLAATHPDLYPTQVRAILRASAFTGRPASIMAPMVTDLADVELVRAIVDEARRTVLDAPAPRVGIMVEVPSAVLLAQDLASRVDFLSIGTNDLTQYLLAADRTNPALSARQDPMHPAVVRAIARVVAAATATAGSCEVAVCGEMASDPLGAMLLVGLGVDELSMEPRAFGAVKRAVAARAMADLERLAEAAMRSATAGDVRAMMEAA